MFFQEISTLLPWDGFWINSPLPSPPPPLCPLGLFHVVMVWADTAIQDKLICHKSFYRVALHDRKTAGPRGEGTPRKIGQGCAASFLKPFSYFRQESLIFSTLCLTQLKIQSHLTGACDKPLPHIHSLHKPSRIFFLFIFNERKLSSCLNIKFNLHSCTCLFFPTMH